MFASEMLNLNSVLPQLTLLSLSRVNKITVESVANLVLGKLILAKGMINEESVSSTYVAR